MLIRNPSRLMGWGLWACRRRVSGNPWTVQSAGNIVTEIDEDDLYLAPPGHQARFERELGRFLVAFNKVEAIVSDIMVMSILDAGKSRSEMRDKLGCRFAERLRIVQALGTPPTDGDPIDYEGIFDLARERNTLAHGHFEDMQFFDTYTLRQPQKLESAPTISIRPGRLREMTKQAKKHYDTLVDVWVVLDLSQWQDDEADD